MLHEPLNDEQILAEKARFENNFAVGECNFEVSKAIEEVKVSKEGKPYNQIVLTLLVFDNDNNQRTLTCWLPEYFKLKIYEFYESISRIDLYNQKSLDVDMIPGNSGRLICFKKDSKNRDGESVTYINVKKFLKPEDSKLKNTQNDDFSEKDDDVPF